MEFSECTKIVFQRIQELDTENVSKIIGSLLLEDHAEHEMIRLAFAPDTILQSLIEKFKQKFALSPKLNIPVHVSPPGPTHSNFPLTFTPFTPASSSRSPPSYSPTVLPPEHGPLNPQVAFVQPIVNPSFQYFPYTYYYVDPSYYSQVPFVPVEPFNVGGSHFQPGVEIVNETRPDQNIGGSRELSPKFHEPPSVQICEHFKQGYCKYGASCKFLHVLQLDNGYAMVLNPQADGNHESRGSVKQFEIELIELLKSRRGIPVPIPSLPILYYEKHGMILQPEAYLARDSNNKKSNVGCALFQLVNQMSNTIRMIDRAHGHRCVILAEDIPQYMKFKEEINENKVNEADFCQVYFTFPPERVFNDQDVGNYFNTYGPVQDVWIASKDQKRMFGFVTFVYPDTVELVLTIESPHFICGTQVVVKPYRPKPAAVLFDRKAEEKVHPAETSKTSSSTPKPDECITLLKMKKKLEENEHTPNVVINSIAEGKLKIGRGNEDIFRESYDDINLPDSPFNSEFGNGMSSSFM